MQEGGIRNDVETWLRYITQKLNKNILDFSAIQRIIHIIIKSPEFQELIASVLIRNLEVEIENSAVMMLHVINTIIFNLRISIADNSDADFLGKILDQGLETLDKHSKKGWKEWPVQLGRTLMEWKQNYKIENRLSKELQKLLENSEKEDLKLRDVHFTCIECIQDLSGYLKDHNSEGVSIHLLRIWENSFQISEPLLEPYNKILYSDSNNEGWNDIIKITEKYLTNMLSSPSTASLIFRNNNTDKMGIIPQVFTVMHAATFIESCVGASVRALMSLLKNTDVQAALNSPNFQRCIDEVINFFQYTLENMHSLSPFLGKYLCETCEIIKKVKHQEDFWNEINGLLVLRLLAPAVSNPVLAGIVEYADMNAVQLLTYAAKIIQHAWVGKGIEHGDLSNLTWVNEKISKWRVGLQNSFYKMLNNRKNEPKSLALPRALLIYDLQGIQSKLKGFSWTRSPGPAMKSAKKEEIKVKEEVKKVFEEIEEDIQVEEEVSVTKAKMKFDEIEDSTPSMQSLPPVLEIFGQRPNYIRTAPPDAFKSTGIDIIHEEPPQPVKEHHKEKSKIDMKDFNSRSKLTQCEEMYLLCQFTQTDEFSNSSKYVQTESENFISKGVQTEPEKQRTKTRSRLESTIHIMDQETSTDLNIDEMMSEYSKMKSKFESLASYRDQETSRIEKINKSWAYQFHELKHDNMELMKKVESLTNELKLMRKVREDSNVPEALTKTYSHSKLKEDLLNKFFINDDHFLRKCDPYYYFDLEEGNKTSRSEVFSPYEDRVSEAFSIGKFK